MTDQALSLNPLAAAIALVADQQLCIKSAAARESALIQQITQLEASVAGLTKQAAAPPPPPAPLFAREDVERALQPMLRRGLLKDAAAVSELTSQIMARPGLIFKIAGTLAEQVAPLAPVMGQAHNHLPETQDVKPLIKEAGAQAPAVDWGILITEGA